MTLGIRAVDQIKVIRYGGRSSRRNERHTERQSFPKSEHLTSHFALALSPKAASGQS